jgi:hypothetical protein
MRRLWLALALIVGLSGSVYGWTPVYRLYVYNWDTKNYYHIRIKNENSRWQDAKNVEAGGCVEFPKVEEGEYSIRIYRDGQDFSDYATFEVTDNDFCIRIRSVTGALESCGDYFCGGP